MRAWLSSLVDRFQAKYPTNRLVALAMAVLAAPLAALGGWLATWVPLHLPGLPAFTGTQATVILGAVVAGGLAAAITAGNKFLDGWQKNEAREHEMWRVHRAEINREVEREHELRLAVASGDNPHLAVQALEEGGLGAKSVEEPPPAADSPSAAIGGAMPPPPPSRVPVAAEPNLVPSAPPGASLQPPIKRVEGPEVVGPPGGGAVMPPAPPAHGGYPDTH